MENLKNRKFGTLLTGAHSTLRQQKKHLENHTGLYDFIFGTCRIFIEPREILIDLHEIHIGVSEDWHILSFTGRTGKKHRGRF